MILWKKSYNTSHMRQNLYRILVLLLSAAVYVACYVKEDRGLCPASLYIEFDSSYPMCPYLADLTVLNKENVICEDEVDLGIDMGEYCVEVSKGQIHVRVWTSTDNMDNKEGLAIPYGYDCPEVYMFDSDIGVYGETARTHVVMRKNHCVMTVVSADGEGFPYGIHVTGNVCGYMADGQPKQGEFYAPVIQKASADAWEVVLPRQSDESLLLHVSDETGVLTTFALGQYLSSSGYDWNCPDLKDVSVTLDYALTKVSVLIDGWESVYTYDMEI